MPVYNEQDLIRQVLPDWIAELPRHTAAYEFLIYDDGSTDGTASCLRELAVGESRIRVIGKPNSGHGPTILQGYREARGEWIFQTDSDGEIDYREFGELWRQRRGGDLILGLRAKRNSSASRKLVTRMAAWITSRAFGRTLQDVNTPFRLMNAAAFSPLFALLPDDTFAPNVILTGLAARRGLRLVEVPLTREVRSRRPSSLNGGFLFHSCLKAFRQTLQVASRAARRPPLSSEAGPGSV